MKRFIAVLLSGMAIISVMPSVTLAETVARKTPRKYDKLLTAVESFAKLNAQIEIREREFAILAPFVQDVTTYADQLRNVCDSKCHTSLNSHAPKLKKFMDSLQEAHRRYQAMTPNITERNAALMSEIKRTSFISAEKGKEKVMADLNRLNLENLYHYKAYATTYHSADKAMLSLAASSDIATIVNSFATTTARLAKLGRGQASMSATIGSLQNKIPDIRARIKAFEDRRKSLVCTATLAADWSVGVRCSP